MSNFHMVGVGITVIFKHHLSYILWRNLKNYEGYKPPVIRIHCSQSSVTRTDFVLLKSSTTVNSLEYYAQFLNHMSPLTSSLSRIDDL